MQGSIIVMDLILAELFVLSLAVSFALLVVLILFHIRDRVDRWQTRASATKEEKQLEQEKDLTLV